MYVARDYGGPAKTTVTDPTSRSTRHLFTPSTSTCIKASLLVPHYAKSICRRPGSLEVVPKFAMYLTDICNLGSGFSAVQSSSAQLATWPYVRTDRVPCAGSPRSRYAAYATRRAPWARKSRAHGSFSWVECSQFGISGTGIG